MIRLAGQGIRWVKANFSKTPYVVIYVTNACDLNCFFCFNKDIRTRSSQLISPEQFDRLARSIHHPFEILISGGEPFLRDDLGSILCSFIRNSHPAVLTIPTNGSQTGNIVRVLENISKSRFHGRLHINLSIDAPGEHHDRIRGKEGLHRLIVDTARAVASFRSKINQIWLGVISIITDDNYNQLSELTQWVNTHIHPDIHDIGLERGFIESNSPDKVISRYQEIERQLAGSYPDHRRFEYRIYSAFSDYLQESILKRHPADGCRAGRSIAVITTDGEVFPCEPFWITPEKFTEFEKTSLGFLKDFDWNLPKLIAHSPNHEILKKIRLGKCSCFWECALFANLLFTSSGWVRLARGMRKPKSCR